MIRRCCHPRYALDAVGREEHPKRRMVLSGVEVAGVGAPDRLIDDALGDQRQLDVVGLADRAQPPERLLSRAAGAASDQPDGLVDDRTAR